MDTVTPSDPSTLLFVLFTLTGAFFGVVGTYTYLKFRQMKKHPEEFPETFQHLHPED